MYSGIKVAETFTFKKVVCVYTAPVHQFVLQF